MIFEVRLYAPVELEQPSAPVARVVLSDRLEQACWLPERLAQQAHFFLARVEAESEDIERRIRSLLQQPSVMVFKSSTRITGAVRTRGDYRGMEPYGTPAYWRAAIALLKSEPELIYDLQDYGRMLEQMEAYDPQDYAAALQRTEVALPIATERLAAALDRLTAMQDDLRERLRAWREQVERGVSCAEVTVRAVLTAGRAGTVEVLPAMSHPSLQAAYPGTGVRVRGGEPPREGQATSIVVITTDAVPCASVAVEGDTVIVRFLDWQAPSLPLVVLVPEDEQSAPRTPDRVEGERGAWTARFEHVLAGAYLLTVAPVSE